MPPTLLLSVTDEIEAHDNFKFKHKQPGVRKALSEQWVGDDIERSTARWVKKERLIDRAHNWYREIVTDLETGNVIHSCEEPLSSHQRHGSAKGQK